MKKYWLSFIIFIGIGFILIYKDSFYISEKVYIIYEKNETFYKNKYKDIFYFKKEGRILQLTSLENTQKIQKDYKEIKNLNIITIDSLSKLLPFSYYETHMFDKNKLERIKIFFVKIDTVKNKINIRQVRQSFIDYD